MFKLSHKQFCNYLVTKETASAKERLLTFGWNDFVWMPTFLTARFNPFAMAPACDTIQDYFEQIAQTSHKLSPNTKTSQFTT